MAGNGAQRGHQFGFGGKPDVAVGVFRFGLSDGFDDGGILLGPADKGADGDAGRVSEVVRQVGGVGQQQEYLPACFRRHLFEHGGDGGQGGQVACQQVVCSRFQDAAAFGGGDADGLVGQGAGGEGCGRAVVAVEDEIDFQQAFAGIEAADGVGAAVRFGRRVAPFRTAVFKAFGHLRFGLPASG